MRSSNSGFTILELIVVMLMGSLVLAMTVQLALSGQGMYRTDLIRTRLNQNLRSALDIIGIDAREAGENLTALVPAVEVINGGAGEADQLVLRRNTIDEVLNVCTSLANSTSVSSISFAAAGATAPGCIYANQTNSYNTWRERRLAAGGTLKVYLFNTVTKAGQFVDYIGESDNGTEYSITITPANTVSAYPVNGAAIYMLEEWRYQVADDYLQLIQNQVTDEPINIAYGISDMQVRALTQDGTALASFTSTNNWTDLKSIEVTLSGADEGWNESFERQVKGEFLPRNVLSN